MPVPDYINEIIETLGHETVFYIATAFKYPEFAQFLRRTYLNSNILQRSLTDTENKSLLIFERHLMAFWTAFPPQLHSNPVIKDLSFFFTLLFADMKPQEHKNLLTIWSLISSPLKSQGNLVYFAPGDYLNFFAARNKKQRIRLAQQLLSLFDESLVSSDTLTLDVNTFIEEFHKFALSAPVKLTYNDLCLLHAIVSNQSSDQSLLVSECGLNKNTVSSRFNWLKNNHILYHRYRIAFDLFKLKPLIILGHTDETTKTLKNDSDIWLISQFEGSENKRLCFLLVPSSYPHDLFIEYYSNKKFTKTSLIFSRLTSLTFISQNISLYDPTLERWDFMPDANSLGSSNPCVCWPFIQSFNKERDFQLTNSMLRILNFYQTFPRSTRREASNYLKTSTSTLTRHLNFMSENNLITRIFGIYAFNLPIFVYFILRVKSQSEIHDVINELSYHLPIIHGGGLKGDYLAMDLQIPFQDHKEIYRFHAFLKDHDYDLVWYQINENPFASHWNFPLDLWDEKEQNWINNKFPVD
ncbi:MAG: hypothetical protein ACTSPV_13515 [Candidatus Hodarchaeales archaeon]